MSLFVFRCVVVMRRDGRQATWTRADDGRRTTAGDAHEEMGDRDVRGGAAEEREGERERGRERERERAVWKGE